MVCSSNQNRSMEAHFLLKRQGLDASSYGTGQHVKLPGPSLREPNVYEFGTPHKQIFDDLRRKDPELRNCILPMLKRNSTVKLAPRCWQENASDGSFDVFCAFEEKVFDMVLEANILHNKQSMFQFEFSVKPAIHLNGVRDMEDLIDVNHRTGVGDVIPGWPNQLKFNHNREHTLLKSVLAVNLDVKDNHEEAAMGARLALDICQKLETADCWEDSIDDIVAAFERQHRRKLLYSISFF